MIGVFKPDLSHMHKVPPFASHLKVLQSVFTPPILNSYSLIWKFWLKKNQKNDLHNTTYMVYLFSLKNLHNFFWMRKSVGCGVYICSGATRRLTAKFQVRWLALISSNLNGATYRGQSAEQSNFHGQWARAKIRRKKGHLAPIKRKIFWKFQSFKYFKLVI